jgi:hypothetical protein
MCFDNMPKILIFREYLSIITFFIKIMHYKTYAKSIQIFEFLCPTWYMSIPMVGMLVYHFFKK